MATPAAAHVKSYIFYQALHTFSNKLLKISRTLCTARKALLEMYSLYALLGTC